MPVTLKAHAGHGAALVHAKAFVLERSETGLRLRLEVESRAPHQLMLMAIASEDAVIAVFEPVEIPAAGTIAFEVRLSFATAVPGVFTLLLDFGEDGRGPLTVMP